VFDFKLRRNCFCFFLSIWGIVPKTFFGFRKSTSHRRHLFLEAYSQKFNMSIRSAKLGLTIRIEEAEARCADAEARCAQAEHKFSLLSDGFKDIIDDGIDTANNLHGTRPTTRPTTACHSGEDCSWKTGA
jgi:hypothetical protein